MTPDVEVSKGIVVNPGRMGGIPCIVGRRIPAAMVANYIVDESMVEVLVDDYDLTYQDIANARGWDRKGRPGELRAEDLDVSNKAFGI